MSSQEISVLCKSLRYRLLQREFVPIAIYLKRVWNCRFGYQIQYFMRERTRKVITTKWFSYLKLSLTLKLQLCNCSFPDWNKQFLYRFGCLHILKIWTVLMCPSSFHGRPSIPMCRFALSLLLQCPVARIWTHSTAVWIVRVRDPRISRDQV